MSAVVQADMFPKEVPLNDVPDTLIFNCSRAHRALNLAIQSAGLEQQDLWRHLGIDKGSWSKIINGQAHFPNDKLKPFCKLVNNNIYLRWLNYQCEHECKPIKSSLEQQLEQERAQFKELEKENKLLRELLKK